MHWQEFLTVEKIPLINIHQWTKVVYGEECHKGSPALKNFKTEVSAGKVILTVFWDVKGVVDTEFIPTGTTTNFGWYWETLRELKTLFRRVRPPTQQPLLWYDNAWPRITSRIQTSVLQSWINHHMAPTWHRQIFMSFPNWRNILEHITTCWMMKQDNS